MNTFKEPRLVACQLLGVLCTRAGVQVPPAGAGGRGPGGGGPGGATCCPSPPPPCPAIPPLFMNKLLPQQRHKGGYLEQPGLVQVLPSLPVPFPRRVSASPPLPP
jgi:hypothetical protein